MFYSVTRFALVLGLAANLMQGAQAAPATGLQPATLEAFDASSGGGLVNLAAKTKWPWMDRGKCKEIKGNLKNVLKAEMKEAKLVKQEADAQMKQAAEGEKDTHKLALQEAKEAMVEIKKKIRAALPDEWCFCDGLVDHCPPSASSLGECTDKCVAKLDKFEEDSGRWYSSGFKANLKDGCLSGCEFEWGDGDEDVVCINACESKFVRKGSDKGYPGAFRYCEAACGY